MRYTVTVAVVGAWLPEWEAPVGQQGFDVPYAERMKVELSVSEGESLDSVLRRAVEVIQPRVTPGGLGFTEDPMSVVYWTWFYEPSDEDGLNHKVYEMASDLILVDADGLARWNVKRDSILYGDLVRSSQRGLLRGEALRPYLVLLLPQGDSGVQVAWETIRLTWEILEGLFVTGQALKLGAEQLTRLRRRLRGRVVVSSHHERWTSRGGGPREIRGLIERRPWEVDDLRAIMGVDTNEQAKAMLELFGCVPGPGGRYEIGEDLEARILRLAEEEAFRLACGGVSTSELTQRECLQRLIEAEISRQDDF